MSTLLTRSTPAKGDPYGAFRLRRKEKEPAVAGPGGRSSSQVLTKILGSVAAQKRRLVSRYGLFFATMSGVKRPPKLRSFYTHFALVFLYLLATIAVGSGSPAIAPESPTPGMTTASSPIESASPTAPASPSATPDESPSESPSPSPTPSLTKERPRPSGESHQPALRANALELAAAFSNDGYKIRDGYWLSTLPSIGQEILLAINLFSGNQYWFSAAFASPANRIALKLYNENGTLVSTQFYETNSKAALGAEPTHSGKYYLGIQLLSGAPANFCVLYSYK